MDKYVFIFGLDELKLFFKGFSYTDSQAEAWYDRLQHYSENEYRWAINELTETAERIPSYNQIAAKLESAKRAIRPRPQERIVVSGGHAPRSDEKYQLQKTHMAGLVELLNIKDAEERKQNAKILQESWDKDFRKLPGYKSKAYCQKVVDDENWEEALKLGIISSPPNEVQNQHVPLFTAEKNGARHAEVVEEGGMW